MTFTTDDGNPYSRPGFWPKMRQAPFVIGPLPKAAPEPVAPEARSFDPAAAAEAELALPEPLMGEQMAREPPAASEPQFEALPEFLAAPIAPRRARTPRARPSLVPLLVAGGVGAAGMAAVLLVSGLRPPARATAPSASQPQPTASVAAAAPAQAAPPTPAPVAAAPPTPARVATAKAPPQPTTVRPKAQHPLHTLAAAAQPPPAAATVAASPVEPPHLAIAPPPPTAAPSDKPFVPAPAPDRNAPIATHVPD